MVNVGSQLVDDKDADSTSPPFDPASSSMRIGGTGHGPALSSVTSGLPTTVLSDGRTLDSVVANSERLRQELVTAMALSSNVVQAEETELQAQREVSS